MCKKDIVVGEIRFPWIESKKAWMLPGGFGESRFRFALHRAQQLDRKINQPTRAGRGV